MLSLKTRVLAALTLLSLLGGSAPSQPLSSPPPQISETTQASVEERLTELEANTALEESTKNRAAEIYRTALTELQRASDSSAQAAEFRRLAQEAPEKLKTIRDELAAPSTNPAPTPPPDATLQQVEQSLAQSVADLQAARQLSTELQSEANRRSERRTTLPELIARARGQLADSDTPNALQPRDDEPTILTDARRTLQSAQRKALQAEIDALEAEAASYDARRDLLPARRDRAQRRITEAEATVASWQGIVSSKRIEQADQAAREAQRLRRDAARQHSILSSFARETSERADTRADTLTLAEQIDQNTRDISDVRSRLSQYRSEFLSIQRRLRASGINRATGLLLRRFYDSLPEPSELKSRIRTTQEALEDAEYKLVELQEERAGAGDIDRVAQELIAQIPPEEINGNRADLEQVARELAAARRDLLDQFIANATTNFDNLVELNTALRETYEQTNSYRTFIEERILWVRSVPGDRVPNLKDIKEASAWLLDPQAWSQAASKTGRFALKNWFITALGVLALLVLWGWGLSFRRKMSRIADHVSRYATDAFRYTLAAFGLTLILAAPAALALYLTGWLLARPEGQPEVAVAIGAGLRAAAFFLFPLALLRQTLRVRGLAEAHFRWPPAAVRSVRRNLRWFIPIIVPLAMLVAAFDHAGDESTNASLGRIIFTVGLIALTIFLYRVLHPSRPALRRLLEEQKTTLTYRFRYVWFLAIVLAPLAFATLSWLGFHYTALQLESRLEDSLVLAFALVLANGIMLRWLFIARRRIAVEDARRKRAQAAAEAAAKAETSDAQPATPDPATLIDEDKIDLPALSTKIRQLFRAAITVMVVIGLYIIWAQALPALRMFDRVQIWPNVQVVESTVQQAPPETLTTPADPARESTSQTPLTPTALLDSQESQSDEPKPEASKPLAITLADLGLALIVVIVTLAAFRNLPGLVEIVVLQRLPLDAGARYALSTVLRYTIAIIGIIIAFNTIGISWGRVQWLAAALTFGLAFGLQEIFANFVSGLIILAERPIRLGDTVTVGTTTGTVSRIRMRATTITDWDLKELVIPNKTFITGDVINWTLSAASLRVIINVGVSYSSDVDKVESLLLSIAKDNNVVMTDPKPQVIFRSFGDSTLNYELRVFIPSIDYFVPIRHDLHTTIIKAFRKAGIEIAFPQRDLHVRSISDLDRLAPDRSNLKDTKDSNVAPPEQRS